MAVRLERQPFRPAMQHPVPLMNILRLAITVPVLLAAFVHACLHAAEPPAWGDVDATRAGLGRYLFHVERLPDDGRIAVPAGFPQIVCATARAGDGSRDVPVEIDAEGSGIVLLLPAEPAAHASPRVIAIETADETKQFDDGRIVLTAHDARVTGELARLEKHPGNARIGFWTNAADSVGWTYSATRWGMYDVRLTYANASPAGTEIAVDVGGTTLTGTLASTGSWYRYATLPLGRAYLPTAGRHEIAVRCTKQVGGAVMNLKAVALTPACEGTPPEQAADGIVTLHGRDATVLGTALRYEPAEKKQTLGFWTRGTDAATWTFSVRRPGEFDVELLQGCGAGQGGSEMLVAFDAGRSSAAELSFIVEDTGGFQAFRPRVVGRVTLSEAGRHDLRIAPRSIAKAAACDIRQIRLLPVKAAESP